MEVLSLFENTGRSARWFTIIFILEGLNFIDVWIVVMLALP